MDSGFRIILAIDELGIEQALHLASEVGKRVDAFKIHNLYDRHGPGVVKQLKQAGARRVWVDAKLHDIPNAVRLRAMAIASSGADIVSAHASGGVKMLQAAVESKLEVYAISVLTSLRENDVLSLFGRPVVTVVLGLAHLAIEAGVKGIVCSPKELEYVSRHKPQLTLVVPGIRSEGKSADDQGRIATPAAAIKAGADYLVVGRQITKASDPVAALEELEREIAGA